MKPKKIDARQFIDWEIVVKQKNKEIRELKNDKEGSRLAINEFLSDEKKLRKKIKTLEEKEPTKKELARWIKRSKKMLKWNLKK